MDVSVQATAAASLAQMYMAAARDTAVNNPLDRAEATQKDVAAEVSMFALKQTLEMAGKFIDLLV